MNISTEIFINLYFSSDELFKLAEDCKKFEITAQDGDLLVLDKHASYDEGYTQVTIIANK